jgi:hypothetical protein
MKIIDLNLLIYAVNQDAPDHGKAKTWWEDCLSGTETIGLPWVVILGFLRIMTSSRIMPRPLSHDQALDFIDDWLVQPPVQIANPTDRHWNILRQLILEFGTAANVTTDAHIAALSIEKGGVLYSSDNDFARFAGLRWINPL